MNVAPSAQRRLSIGTLLVALWVILFLLGAAGDLFDVRFLRDVTDVKRIFLR